MDVTAPSAGGDQRRASTEKGCTTGKSRKGTVARVTMSICTENGAITVPGTVKKAVASTRTSGSITGVCQQPAGSTNVTGAVNRDAVM